MFIIDPAAKASLAHDYAARYTALPLKRTGNVLEVAISPPFEPAVLRNLAAATRLFISPIPAEASEIRYYINQIYGEEAISSIAAQFNAKLNEREINPELLKELNAAPAVRLLDTLIDTGVLHRASDLHIEPYSGFLRARYRVDGELFTHGTVDISLLPNIISRLKVMGDMDIAEKRMPQDGHFTALVGAENVDFRISTMPTLFGEKAAIRLLFSGRHRVKKEELGYTGKDLTALTQLFRLPHGAVIVTGPTGSGKSTTLSVFLEELNSTGRNIVTIEDPVENPLPGVNHVNVSPVMGFADALKYILRQDPDIIMVGEMRDEQTARIAIQAAMTGHVVLSTLHTNDAAGVIERLADMGIEPYLAASALNGIISQRLVRRICPDCARPAVLSAEEKALVGVKKAMQVYKGTGCAACHQSGYKGRFAVYEYVILDAASRREMADDPIAFARKLRERRSLRKNALEALTDGRTTAEEIIKALHRDG